MKGVEIRDIIEAAEKDPSLMATDKFIEANLSADFLIQLALQMGPNCNRSCGHCYGEYGPNRKGLPKPKMVEGLLDEAHIEGLDFLVLTDGEPLRHENREVMKIIASHPEYHIRILTNGTFARTQANAISWFQMLKDHGYNIEQEGNRICVSCGTMYDVPVGNYLRINKALQEVFPEADLGNVLRYQCLWWGQGEEREHLIKVFETIVDAFGEHPVEIDDSGGCRYVYLQIPDKAPIRLTQSYAFPDGRACDIPLFHDQKKLLSVEDCEQKAKHWESVWVGSNGDVSFGASGACVRDAKIYGNLSQDRIGIIKQRIFDDPIYIAHRLGGAKFLYHLAQEIDPGFVIEGFAKCDACHAIFSDHAMTQAIRDKLPMGTIVKQYKEFIEEHPPA